MPKIVNKIEYVENDGTKAKRKETIYYTEGRAEFPAWNTGILDVFVKDQDNYSDFEISGRDRTDHSVTANIVISGIVHENVVPGIRSLINVLEDLIAQLPKKYQVEVEDE